MKNKIKRNQIIIIICFIAFIIGSIFISYNYIIDKKTMLLKQLI